MRLHIEHETVFSYSQPVREAIGEAKLRPRDDAGQRLIGFRLALDPHAPFDVVGDRFGNTIHCYSVLPAHRRLVVSATSEVETSADALIDAPTLTLLEQYSFTAASPFVPLTEDLLAFARANVPADADPETTARALATAIYDSCTYEPGSTTISTTADAVLAGRRGVCQDFAHLLIGLCRAIGLPARYVSGYLFDTSKPADAVLASHAWTEVSLGGRGWLGLDPTHNRATGPLYARLALGRDYADAAPVRGIYQGDADEKLEVRVRMRALPEPAPIVR